MVRFNNQLNSALLGKFHLCSFLVILFKAYVMHENNGSTCLYEIINYIQVK